MKSPLVQIHWSTATFQGQFQFVVRVVAHHALHAVTEGQGADSPTVPVFSFAANRVAVLEQHVVQHPQVELGIVRHHDDARVGVGDVLNKGAQLFFFGVLIAALRQVPESLVRLWVFSPELAGVVVKVRGLSLAVRLQALPHVPVGIGHQHAAVRPPAARLVGRFEIHTKVQSHFIPTAVQPLPRLQTH